MDLVKLICTFLDPSAAKKIFNENETSVVENTGFDDDLASLNASEEDLKKINEFLESMN